MGSLFEASSLEAGWLREVAAEVRQLKPAFFALHMQEIGGKNYRTCMRFVRGFIEDLREAFAQDGYSHGKAYLDEEFEATDRFTALGSAYFCHRDFAKRVSLFDFRRNAFQTLSGFEVCSLNENGHPTADRKRFPKAMFSEVKWSRKGFMRTRWRVDELTFDLVNIHLFHDACNLLAVEQSPSVYSSHRREALTYTLNELGQSAQTKTPLFLFGDFNFRVDARSFIESLAPMCDQQPVRDRHGAMKVEYRRLKSSECILSIGTKTFEHENHDKLQHSELLQFDKELVLYPELSEWPISFPPSYPYCEDVDSPTMYMRTRVPSWCDRVLMNEAAMNLVKMSARAVKYSTIGQATCMGDHKPVYLMFSLPVSSHGTYESIHGDAISALRWRPSTLEQTSLSVWSGKDARQPTGNMSDPHVQSSGQQADEENADSWLFSTTMIRNDYEELGEATCSADDYVTTITLHDDRTVTVMDASSYGLSFNSSWTGTLERWENSNRIFDNIEEEDENLDTDEDGGSLIPVTSRTGTSGGSDAGSVCTVAAPSVERVDSDNSLPFPTSSFLPPPVPPSTPDPTNMLFLVFISRTDSDLISPKRSIMRRYPYYDTGYVNDHRRKQDAVYAKPFALNSSVRRSNDNRREIQKSCPFDTRYRNVRHLANHEAGHPIGRIGKGVQVEFTRASIRPVLQNIDRKYEDKVVRITRKDNVCVQTDPLITRDENCLQLELKRRRKVGLDQWVFDGNWDIARESFTEERVSIGFLKETPKTKLVTIDETPNLVQTRPVSARDRKLARRRLLEKKTKNCTCF